MSALLEVRDLHVWLGDHAEQSEVVRGLDLEIHAGERVGLIGESGCGKTTSMMATLGLLPQSARTTGEVRYLGEDVLRGGEAKLRSLRWKEIAIVFQGAMNSLNPVVSIGAQIAEPLRIHEGLRRTALTARVHELLAMVGLPLSVAKKYPHELSGGMKQRACIAMALSCEPSVLLADEPTTALDVLVQEQILDLLHELTTQLGLALLLVTHDLPIVSSLCTRGAVMLDGRVVEEGPISQLYAAPQHAYTKQLYDSVPQLNAAPGSSR